MTMMRDVFEELKHTDWRNFFTWSRRVKHCVIVICGVLTWLLSFLFLNLSQYSSLSTAQAKETELKQTLATTIPTIITLQQEKNQLDQIEKLIAQQNRKLPLFDQLGPILDGITQASADNRVDLALLKPNAIVNVAPYETVPIEVEVNGNYETLTRFLNQLAHLPYELYPSQVTLAPPDSSKKNETETLTADTLHLKMIIDMYYVPPTKPYVNKH